MSFKALLLLCRLGHGPTKTLALVTAQLKRVDGPLTVFGSVSATEPGGSNGLGIMGVHCLEAFWGKKTLRFPSISQLGFVGGAWR